MPTEASLILGRQIKSNLESKWRPPHFYAHLKAGGHVAALKSHLGNKYFIRADIKNFFNSINRTRVTRELKLLLGRYEDSRDTANASTVSNPENRRESILPFGFVQSPIIASLCLCNSALGNYLNKLDKRGFTVSVYMDDIIISTTQHIEIAESVFDDLIQKADRSNFSFNPKKTIGPVESITAFNVNLSSTNLEITNERFRAFKDTFNSSPNINVQEGIRSYIGTISHEQVDLLIT